MGSKCVANNAGSTAKDASPWEPRSANRKQVVLSGQTKPTCQQSPERVLRVSSSLASKSVSKIAWDMDVAKQTWIAKICRVDRGSKGMWCVVFMSPKWM